MAEFKQLKYYYDKELAELLANKITPVYSKFNKKDFVNAVTKGVR